ncbi:MAG: LytTR family DNA-binding domain-containing protein [Oscillospiraceae bacterium]|jgi:DNA-binding LytR/AlgR family response regulator|nr:LytTR family DNA-binding domain-containing protein [Oscillospiraceae bacterium]
MYKISICDDDRDFVENFSLILKNEFISSGVDISIFHFYNGMELIKSSEDFDIMFLDIEMPGFSGFETADNLVEKINQNNTLLIFCTNHDGTVYDTYKFHPFWFLRKSFLDTQLSEVLNAAMTVLKSQSKEFEFSVEGLPIVIKMQNIMFFEVSEKKLRLHTENKSYYFNGTLIGVWNKIDQEYFIRCHKNYIVNCNFIRSIGLNEITLLYNQKLPVSKRRGKQIREDYHNFVFYRGGKKW